MTVQSVPQARTGPMPTGGRWGWYQDHEGNSYRRASKLIKKVETDTYNLDLWFKRQVAEGLAIRDDLVFALKSMGRPPAEGWTKDQKKEIDRICKDAAEAAKQRDGAKVGTAFHTLTERVDRGEPIEQVAAGLPGPAAATIRAYAHLRALNGWRTVEIERTVVCDELEVAGTFDRVELVPGLAAMLGPGDCQHEHAARQLEHRGDFPELPIIADVKTEEAPWLNGLHIGPQLGIYSRARRMWRPTGGSHTVTSADGATSYEVPDGEYVPAPCVRQDVAVVVHLRDGKAEPYFINLTEGWEAAQAAYAQMNREARAKRKLGAAGAWFAPVPGIKRPAAVQVLTEVAVAADYANPNRPAAVAEAAYGDSIGVDPGPVMPSGADLVGGHGPLPAGPGVAWEQKTTAEMTGLPGAEAAEQMFDEKDELRRLLIDAIWKAVTTDGLAILWNMARDRGVSWTGPVEQAAAARARQIGCPQRALHAGGGKCACGWVAGVAA